MLIHGSLRWPESSPTGALRPRSLLLLAGVGRSQASSNEPSRGEAAAEAAPGEGQWSLNGGDGGGGKRHWRRVE
jgi:hypothetical protein